MKIDRTKATELQTILGHFLSQPEVVQIFQSAESEENNYSILNPQIEIKVYQNRNDLSIDIRNNSETGFKSFVSKYKDVFPSKKKK